MKAFMKTHPILTGALGTVIALVLVVASLAFVDARALNPRDPIDWDTKERTATGFRETGIVFDFELDCTTGQLRADTPIFGFNVMTVDEGFVAKHKPDEACERYGWQPQF